MPETIGVCIATYNGEKYIEEQLKSIINQKRPVDYIVISDGCSEDATLDICEKILSRNNIDFKILRSDKRLSVTENFERGLKELRTDYIFLSDQDDFWKRDKTSIAIEQMKLNRAKLFFSNAELVDEHLHEIRGGVPGSLAKHRI